MNKRLHNDILLITILAVLITIFCLFRGNKGSSAVFKTVKLAKGDEILYEEHLTKDDLPIDIPISLGENENTFRVDADNKGDIYLECISANCLDEICVKTGKIYGESDIIVCLPHRITARIY